MTRSAILAALTTTLALLHATPALAQEDRPTPFDQGRTRVSAGGSLTSGYGGTYFVIGAGVGHFVLDGLELGASGQIWLGSGPFVAQVSPQIRYVLMLGSAFAPYLGTFYRHWFVGSGIEDIDSLGARLGFYLLPGGGFLLGLGVAYEQLIGGCEVDCGRLYPEFGLSISF